MDGAFALLVIIVTLGLVFDFINGFHDTANAIATSVATRVLSPAQAVTMAAVLNFAGALTGTAVAATVGKGLIPPEASTQQLVISALIAAITWNLFTWYLGLPSSSSHALVFSIVGAGVASGGWQIIEFKGLEKTFQGLVLSPLLGFLGAYLIMVVLLNLFARKTPVFVTRFFGRAQLASAAQPLTWPSHTARTTLKRRWASSPWRSRPITAGRGVSGRCPPG
jgi:PiT family inorganic phosphate transporter